MQAAEVVMTLAALPEWTGQVTLLLLALGFPIALILSWFYELTPEGLSLDKDVEADESSTRVTGRRADFIVIAVLCAAVILFAFDKWWVSGPPIMSIAVLPLDDFSGDLQQPGLANGMTDVLTAELGQIGNLQVTSRTSAKLYENTDKPLPKIATELGVDAIVEGSIQTAGDEVWLTIQLIDGHSDRHLWARSYQRNLQDVLTLQGNIARTIANEIRITLTPQTAARFERDRTTDPEALRLWAIGNMYLQNLDENSFNRALQAFTEASHIDPGFADAYAGIAHSYLYLGSWHATQETQRVLPLAKIAAEKAAQLDPELADAHFALARIYVAEWNWENAEVEFREAFTLNNSDAHRLVEFANFLNFTGRNQEAIKIAARAVELDPLSPAVYNELAWAYMHAGRYEEAMEQFQRSLQLDPVFLQTHILLTSFYLETGNHDNALKHLEIFAGDLESTISSDLAFAAASYAQVGRIEYAVEVLALLKERKETQHVPALAFAKVYLALGDYGVATTWLETAYEERDLMLVWVLHPTRFERESIGPRIQAIRSDMALPARLSPVP